MLRRSRDTLKKNFYYYCNNEVSYMKLYFDRNFPNWFCRLAEILSKNLNYF